jgi:hypothetical protein
MASNDKGEKKSKGKAAEKAAEKPAAAAKNIGSTASSTPAAKKAGDLYRIPRDSGWARASMYAGVVAVVGILGSIALWSGDSHRFAFSWLFAVMTFLAISLGSLFLLLFQHITMGHWGIVIRRTHETIATGVVVIAVFVVPLMAMHLRDLYPWMELYDSSGQLIHEGGEDEESAAREEHSRTDESLVGASIAHAQDRGEPAELAHAEEHTPEHAEHHEILERKAGYLNPGFFYGRMVVYLAIWIGLAFFYHRRSTQQDVSKDRQITVQLNKASPVSLFLLALSLTFAAFDWMMSLEPTWFSTIFGVQYFAVSLVASLATCIVLTHLFRNAGLIGDAVNQEHFHDMGKLLFGFLVFWAYITFSQFMLIWYASIPEETTYYHLRFAGGWRTFSWFLLICHFFVPFFGILSRNIKRRIPLMAAGAAWLLVMHVLQMYWLVMPYAMPHAEGPIALQPSPMDLVALLAVGGSYLAFIFFRMSQHPLLPVGDPRLADSLHHEVT